MCDECCEAVKEIFPDVPENEIGDFLMNCTCFPFGEAETVTEQLRELRRKTDDYRRCAGIVEDEMEAAMKEFGDPDLHTLGPMSTCNKSGCEHHACGTVGYRQGPNGSPPDPLAFSIYICCKCMGTLEVPYDGHELHPSVKTPECEERWKIHQMLLDEFYALHGPMGG